MNHRPIVVGACASAVLMLVAACPSLDLSPNHFACQRDAGDVLPDGTRQCAEGWHCGVEGYCYELATAGAVRCEPAAGDCAAGWTCGLDGVCHPEEPGAWVCTEDSHCFGWRCGVEGRCTDPSAEALTFDTFPAAIEVQRENPVMFTALPDKLAMAPPVRTEGAGFVNTLHAAALGESVDGGYQLTHVIARTSENKATGERIVQISPYVVTLGRAPEDVAALADRLIWSERPQNKPQLFGRRRLADGGIEPLPTASILGARIVPVQVQVGMPTDGRIAVAAFDPGTAQASYVRQDASTKLLVPVSRAVLDGGAGGETLFRDIRFISYAALNPLETGGLLVATNRSIHHVNVGPQAQLEGGDDRPTWCELPQATVDALLPSQGGGLPDYDVQLRPRGIQAKDDPALLAVAVTRFASEANGVEKGTTLSLLASSSGKVGEVSNCDLNVPQELLFGPCPDPCQEFKQELVDFAPLRLGPLDNRIEVLCGSRKVPIPGRHLILRKGGIFEPTCVAESLTGSPVAQLAFRTARSDLAGIFVTAQGQVTAGESVAQSNPITLPGAPLGTLIDPTSKTPVAILPKGFALPNPTAGWAYTSVATADNMTAVVDSQPWVVFDNGYVVDTSGSADGGARVVAVTNAPFLDRVEAITAPRRGGGHHLIVTAFDQILGATVHDEATAPEPLEVRLIPFSRTPIVGVAALDGFAFADGGMPLSAGYVITGSRAFRFHAETDARWRDEELFVPDGELIDVWVDPSLRGRVGYRDGRIASLPSGLLLAPPIDDSAGVSDFADVCGQPWAIARSGVYRLMRPEEGAVGRWERVPLPPPLEPKGNVTVDLGVGRLHAEGNRLYVFSGYGAVARIDASCEGSAP